MNSVTTQSKIMQNFTICIPKPIREQKGWKQGDKLILSMNEDGDVKLIKAITSWDELRGIGKETFEALGGGEAFIKSEREAWGD